MFRNIILFLLFLLLFQTARAQESKRANIWYFGYGAGIDFNSGKPVALDDSKMNQWEGTASICDEDGKLLLYTNGIQIWNNKHKVIEGAEDLGGNSTSTQSAIIIPKPGDPNIYYVFTTFTNLSCVIIDIRLNQGDGGIVSRYVLMEHSTEKLAAVQHCNGKDFWILAHEAGNNTFRNYLLTKNGLENSFIKNTIGSHYGHNASLGYLKFSSSGNKLVSAVFGKATFELYNFDRSSGLISFPVLIAHPDFLRAYGLEFSPDENFLYVTETLETASSIFQLDISNRDAIAILKSKTTIGRTTESYFGALKLGADNRIYVAIDKMKSLGVINNPNSQGISCDYANEGFDLKSTSGIGLPNSVASFNMEKPSLSIIEEKNCNDVTMTANFYPDYPNKSYQWYVGHTKIVGAVDYSYKPDRSGAYSVSVSSKCLYEKISSPKKEVKILKAEPRATKVNCGIYKLTTNTNSDFQWISENIKEADQKLDNIIVNSSGLKTFKLKVFDKEDPTCFIEKDLEIDFGVCDAQIFIPDVFTPNQDGKNDTFKIIVVGGSTLTLHIYNRWGSLIFTDTNPSPEWNGRFNSTDCAIGNYIYVFRYKTETGEEFVRRGSVLLQR